MQKENLMKIMQKWQQNEMTQKMWWDENMKMT